MKFQNYLITQLKLHPCIQPADIVKLCYQAAFGAEHLLNDLEQAENYFYSEYNSVPEMNCELYEEISDSVCRINLAAWKASGMPAEWLFRMFVNSANIAQGGKEVFLQNLEKATELLQTKNHSFTLDTWNQYLKRYQEEGIHAVHHSQTYRNQERPAYRIVCKRFLRLLPILKAAALLPNKTGAKVIVIDGRAASGKSTVADDLEMIMEAGIVHMDDFFLPLELRNYERYAEPGGNIHYERFSSEVLPYISNTDRFSYTVFDCRKMDYIGSHFVTHSKWRIIEGAYCCHPYFGEYADLKIFSDIDPNEQMSRLINRNGAQMAERFRTEWIPYEEKYYKQYKIKENADIIIPCTQKPNMLY